MRIEETLLPGVVIVHPDVYCDDRGFLLETYSKERYDAEAFGYDFVQDNHSRSRRGVLRGLHFQEREPQGKLVRVSRDVYSTWRWTSTRRRPHSASTSA